MKELFLKTDSRNRISLTKAVGKASSVYKVTVQDGKIILEPMVEMSKHEEWLYAPENKAILDHVKESLKQKADIYLGTFEEE